MSDDSVFVRLFGGPADGWTGKFARLMDVYYVAVLPPIPFQLSKLHKKCDISHEVCEYRLRYFRERPVILPSGCYAYDVVTHKAVDKKCLKSDQ